MPRSLLVLVKPMGDASPALPRQPAPFRRAVLLPGAPLRRMRYALADWRLWGVRQP
jgi:hypothetical protein